MSTPPVPPFAQPDVEPTGSGTPLVRRRLLFGGAAAVAGVAGALATAEPAAAVAGTQAWLAGGNPNIATDGTNFIGTTTVADLIFKTTATTGATPTERLRITSGSGRVGIGVSNPGAKLDVRTGDTLAVRATSVSTATNAVMVSGSTPNGVGVNGISTNNIGVQGNGGYAGVMATGGSYGTIANGTSIGSYATGTTYGVYGAATSYGVFGSGDSGVRGVGTTYGVYGSGTTGVYGTTSDPNASAVLGDGGQYGVHGQNGHTAGVRGESGYVGVWGQATSYGVYGIATDPTNQSFGLFGQASNASSYAVYSQGNCRVAGTLSKSAGSFIIDHPLDPENKWLSHSFVESPDMMNVYNGVAVCDATGEANVQLPAWFDKLNRDFRYQLTPIGAAAPSLHVKSKIAGNAFRIGGGTPGLEVSWQVTGIRQDDYAKEHPIVVEAPKAAHEKGTRLFVPHGSSARAFVPITPPPAHPPLRKPAATPTPKLAPTVTLPS